MNASATLRFRDINKPQEDPKSAQKMPGFIPVTALNQDDTEDVLTKSGSTPSTQRSLVGLIEDK